MYLNSCLCTWCIIVGWIKVRLWQTIMYIKMGTEIAISFFHICLTFLSVDCLKYKFSWKYCIKISFKYLLNIMIKSCRKYCKIIEDIKIILLEWKANGFLLENWNVCQFCTTLFHWHLFQQFCYQNLYVKFSFRVLPILCLLAILLKNKKGGWDSFTYKMIIFYKWTIKGL